MFFNKSSIAKIVGVGQAKASEEQGYIPLIQIVPDKGAKSYPKFFAAQRIIRGEFRYVRPLRMLSLVLQTPTIKLAIPFESPQHLGTLAGLMKLGDIAINDQISGNTVVFPLHAITEKFQHEWKEIVFPDFIKDNLKKHNQEVEDIVAYRDQALYHFENNWMVEKKEEGDYDEFV